MILQHFMIGFLLSTWTPGHAQSVSDHAAIAAPAAAHTVTVVATDYRLSLPSVLPQGPTAFQVVNHGRELHQLFLVRLLNGKSAGDLAAAMKAPGPLPSWAVAVGGPNGVDPGATSLVATVNLWPGHYAALCIIPGPDGVPHLMKGMISELTVTPSTPGMSQSPLTKNVRADLSGSGSSEAKSDLKIDLVDYAFQPSKTITAGHHVALVTNHGKQMHELEIAELLPGKTPGDLAAWAEKMAGPPPARFLGGVSPIAPGKSNLLALDLARGHYVFLCFLPDAKDGKPHTAHGMVRDLVVN